MARQFCSFSRSADAACMAFHAGATTESVIVHSRVDLTWDTFGNTSIAEQTQATALPGGALNVNTLIATWLLVATTTGGLYLIDQKAQATSTGIAALLPSGDYAIYGRLVDGRFESFEQN